MGLFRFFTLINIVALCAAGADSDPSHWPDKFCGGLNQSPVNICTEDVVANPTLGNILYTNFNTKTPRDLELVNYKGEQAKLRGFGDSIRIQDGGLPAASYILEQLHFHVGSDDDRGSEHGINGEFYPAEMHVVFYSCDYPDYHAAANRPQGIAVLAVLFEVSDEDNETFEPIVSKLCNIKYPGQTVKVEALKVRDLLPDDISRWYRYRGSLTTPPCYQSVIWTIYKDLAKISERQLNDFRRCLFTNESIYGSTNRVSDNFRPVQPLNGRMIEENTDDPCMHCDVDEISREGGGRCHRHSNDDEDDERLDSRCNGRKRGRYWKPRPGCYDDREREREGD